MTLKGTTLFDKVEATKYSVGNTEILSENININNKCGNIIKTNNEIVQLGDITNEIQIYSGRSGIKLESTGSINIKSNDNLNLNTTAGKIKLQGLDGIELSSNNILTDIKGPLITRGNLKCNKQIETLDLLATNGNMNNLKITELQIGNNYKFIINKEQELELQGNVNGKWESVQNFKIKTDK